MKYAVFAMAAALVALAASAAYAQQGSDTDYINQVMKGAPRSVVTSATIVQMNGKTMRTIQQGSNGFTCMVMPDTTPACADKNAMAWINAMMTHSTPPSSTGFVYMLAGDPGASNTDPYAQKQTPTNHWVKTGPHVMIVGPTVSTMGYPSSADPDVTKPYVMWPGTPYAHLMIPVSVGQP